MICRLSPGLASTCIVAACPWAPTSLPKTARSHAKPRILRAGRSSACRPGRARTAASGPTSPATRWGSSRARQPPRSRRSSTPGPSSRSRAGSRASGPWLTSADDLRPALGRLVGAAAEEVVAMNTLTVNLHLLMSTFYRPTAERFRIVIEDAAFPSDSHAVASQVRHHGFDPARAVVRLRPREGEAALRTDDVIAELERLGGGVALVLLGGVNYLTGELFDIPEVTAAAHDDRRGRRLGSRARGRQRAARAQCLGRRLGRVVPLQVRQRRAGRAGRRVRPRAPRERRVAAAPGRLVGQRPGHALPHGAGVRAAARRGRLAGLDASRAGLRAAARVAGAVRRGRDAGAARALAAPHRLPRGAARRRRRRTARADAHAA